MEASSVRVLPDVTGLDKEFDYSVPESLRSSVAVGAIVRADLHGRRISGWVTAIDPPDVFDALTPITHVTGVGPTREVIELGSWAATRWVARRRHFLVAASPVRAVRGLPADRSTGVAVEPRSPATTKLIEGGGGVLRLPPASDPFPTLASAAAIGPTLAIHPSVDRCLLIAARLRRAGLSVAVMPNDWAAAAGGVDVVLGARSAAWAPCAGLSAIVVLDEHDEGLQEEGSPTWHARDVLIERGRRAGVPVVLVSPTPTLTAVEWADSRVVHPPTDRERRGWPTVEIIDRTDTEPWKRSLVTSRLIAELRDRDRRVVCVSNTTGRAKLLACRSCRALARCERCEAAVELVEGRFWCRRCGAERPEVCASCGRTRFSNLRPGISRLREELEAAADRPVGLVQAGEIAPGALDAPIVVGTEAALHRIDRSDTVVFLDFDRELLAPRYRAAEQAMALIVRAARMVGPRSGGGRVLVQTFVPNHEVLVAARLAQPGRLIEAERPTRELLGLPPFGAFAEVSGAGSDEFVASLGTSDRVAVVGGDGEYVARSSNWDDLGAFLSSGKRPPGARLRIAVDPPRA